MLQAKTKEQKTTSKETKVTIKVGDFVILTDPINNGQCVEVLALLDDGYIQFEGGITKSYYIFQ